MSRLPMPYSKNDIHPDYTQQIPVYAYTSEALKIFSSNAKTLNEIHEDVELLRFIDLGLKIKMCETSVVSVSVDFPDDVLKVESFLNNI
jgi:3-deoxy-manno-octulosonate cytidylyltransferase (CMP-KDO synthetase)